MAPTIFGKKVVKGAAKKKAIVFTIDCAKPVEDKIMEVRVE
jgi:large subunit ribosomal protein L22e